MNIAEIEKQKAIEKVLEGNLLEVLAYVSKGWITLADITLLPTDFYSKGEFENCFKSLNTVIELLSPNHELKEHMVNLREFFLARDYDKALPEPTDYNYKQSVEDANQTYDELEVLDQLQAAKSEYEFDKIMETIRDSSKSDNYEISANAYFVVGTIHLLNDNLEKAKENYLMAVQINPNKAIHWGYLSFASSKSGVHPYICSRYCMKAIELDPKNPRWRLEQSLILLRLCMVGINDVRNQAIAEAHLALDLCRDDQVALKNSILEYIKTNNL